MTSLGVEPGHHASQSRGWRCVFNSSTNRVISSPKCSISCADKTSFRRM
jgi:hypothetical protein